MLVFSLCGLFEYFICWLFLDLLEGLCKDIFKGLFKDVFAGFQYLYFLKEGLNLTGFENLSGFLSIKQTNFKLKRPEINNFFNY